VLIDGIQTLIGTLPSVATIERHDGSRTFKKQFWLTPRSVLGNFPQNVSPSMN